MLRRTLWWAYLVTTLTAAAYLAWSLYGFVSICSGCHDAFAWAKAEPGRSAAVDGKIGAFVSTYTVTLTVRKREPDEKVVTVVASHLPSAVREAIVLAESIP